MKKVVVSILILGVVLAVALIGAIALFTDQEENPDNAFTTGTVDLAIVPATAMFTVLNMAPGDVTYKGIELTNSGSLELRYAMTTTVGGNNITLAEELDLTIDVVTGIGVDNTWYTADDVVGEANIYGPDGALSSAFIGNPAPGNQTGHRILIADGNERLRFKVTLPLSTEDEFQDTTCTVDFVFDAEQTVNNP
jgi:predicted ribosomally synthesized peptide with SipW-like signal peptide